MKYYEVRVITYLEVQTLRYRYTNVGLPKLFHFLNFFVRLTIKKKNVLALAAGIKVFGSQKFFWVYVYLGCGSFLFYELFSVSIQKTEK